jgi:undecaprenyl-diphosphatase
MSVVGGVDSGSGRALLRQVQVNLAAWGRWLRRPARGTAPPRWRSGPVLVAGGLGIAALIVVAMFTIDAPTIIAARQLSYPVHRLFAVITDFGKSGWFLWPLGLLLMVIALAAAPRLGRIGERVLGAVAVRLTFLFLAIGVPGLFASLAKNMIGRARPFVGGSANPFLYHPFDWRPAYASLPSGHTTTAVAAAIAIGALWPRSRPYLWAYAVVIAVSRLVITAHHPSDVLAGALVGGVGALLVRDWFAARRLGFAVESDGSVMAMPGPSWQRLKRVAARLFGK